MKIECLDGEKGCDEAIRSHENSQADSIYEPRLNIHYPDVSFEYPAKKTPDRPL